MLLNVVVERMFSLPISVLHVQYCKCCFRLKMVLWRISLVREIPKGSGDLRRRTSIYVGRSILMNTGTGLRGIFDAGWDKDILFIILRSLTAWTVNAGK